MKHFHVIIGFFELGIWDFSQTAYHFRFLLFIRKIFDLCPSGLLDPSWIWQQMKRKVASCVMIIMSPEKIEASPVVFASAIVTLPGSRPRPRARAPEFQGPGSHGSNHHSGGEERVTMVILFQIRSVVAFLAYYLWYTRTPRLWNLVGADWVGNLRWGSYGNVCTI